MDLAEYQVAKAANERKMQILRGALARSAEEEAMQRTRAEGGRPAGEVGRVGLRRISPCIRPPIG